MRAAVVVAVAMLLAAAVVSLSVLIAFVALGLGLALAVTAAAQLAVSARRARVLDPYANPFGDGPLPPRPASARGGDPVSRRGIAAREGA